MAEDMGLLALMLGAGMTAQAGAQASNGYFGHLASERWASASESVAGSQARAEQAIAERNATAMENITQTQANASVSNTQWQVMGMIFAANSQYLQGMRSIQAAELADMRQSMNFRMQLWNEMKMTTLAYNAQLHMADQQHQERMTEMGLAHDERMAELEQPVVQEIEI